MRLASLSSFSEPNNRLDPSLRYIPSGIAYAIWSGIGIILISLLAWWVHGQRLNLAVRAGMLLIGYPRQSDWDVPMDAQHLSPLSTFQAMHKNRGLLCG